MKPDIRQHPYNTVVNALLGRLSTPQEIIALLAELNEFDYLDWEGFLEERESEIRISRIFRECSECKIVSNTHAWVSVKRNPIGSHPICHDCARLLESQHGYSCAWCQKLYLSLRPQQQDMDVCIWHDTHLVFVRKHLRRAEILNLPATLTVKQWRVTVDYFGDACAYCGDAPYTGMEHYLPLSLGGGSTADNCFPSCNRCNSRKGDKHPDEFASLFPAGNLARIQSYFAQLTEDAA